MDKLKCNERSQSEHGRFVREYGVKMYSILWSKGS